MGEAVTQGQFYDAMRSLDEKLQANHRSQREHMDETAENILTVFRVHERDDRVVADRVLVIEEQRKVEKETATRRSAIAGSVAAGVLLGLIEALKKTFGTHP